MSEPRRKRAASMPEKGESGLTQSLSNKEQGYILCVDQATNTAGITLWLNGEVIAGTALEATSKNDPFSVKMRSHLVQLTDFLNANLPSEISLNRILFEGVRSRLCMVVVGAYCACPRITAKLHPTATFIETPQWKSWARKHGALEPEFGKIKGVKALTETGFFNTTNFRTDSDDIADSILIYLTWRDREK